MSTATDAVDKVRQDTQDLYKLIEASMAQNHARIREDLQDAAKRAEQLASSLRQHAKDQRTDAKAHLEHAASLLEEGASSARSVAAATHAELRQTALASLERTRDALQSLSQAVAAKRAGAKQRA
jgi:ElaB/YqjD/DUF883 family membrane-anchored ribosome-binding protein